MSWFSSLPAALFGAATLVVASPSAPAGVNGAPVPHPQAASAEDAPLLIRAERIVVRPGEVLEGGVVLVRDGRIVAVGKVEEVTVPEGAREIQGKTVCAAFIDLWSALGVPSTVLEDASPSAATRTVDGFDPYSDAHLRAEALRAGVTVVRLQGGYREPIGGLGAVVRLAPGIDRHAGILSAEADLGMSIGLSREASGQIQVQEDGSWFFNSGSQAMDPFDRIDQVDRVASNLESGRAYRQDEIEYRYELEAWEKAIAEKQKELDKEFKKAKKDREKEQKDAEEKGKEFKEKKYKEDKKPRTPRFDEDKQVLGRAADGEIPLIVEVHRAAEIRNLLATTEAFPRLRLMIAGGSEAVVCAAELAERHVPVIVWPSLRGTTHDDEFEGPGLTLAAELAEAGVPVLFGSGGRNAAASRDLPLLVALAVGHGFDADAAFEALTLGAAGAVDLADRLGSIEFGKEAELLVVDGDPLAATSRITHVISGGRVVASPEN